MKNCKLKKHCMTAQSDRINAECCLLCNKYLSYTLALSVMRQIRHIPAPSVFILTFLDILRLHTTLKS